MTNVKRTERGWSGHFICADRCLFRRNTLLEYKQEKVVVSTVGLMVDLHNFKERVFETIGYNRYYETMVFFANLSDERYYDINISLEEIQFNSKWSIDKLDADDEANDMHENVIIEVSEMLVNGLVREANK